MLPSELADELAALERHGYPPSAVETRPLHAWRHLGVWHLDLACGGCDVVPGTPADPVALTDAAGLRWCQRCAVHLPDWAADTVRTARQVADAAAHLETAGTARAACSAARRALDVAERAADVELPDDLADAAQRLRRDADATFAARHLEARRAARRRAWCGPLDWHQIELDRLGRTRNDDIHSMWAELRAELGDGTAARHALEGHLGRLAGDEPPSLAALGELTVADVDAAATTRLADAARDAWHRTFAAAVHRAARRWEDLYRAAARRADRFCVAGAQLQGYLVATSAFGVSSGAHLVDCWPQARTDTHLYVYLPAQVARVAETMFHASPADFRVVVADAGDLAAPHVPHRTQERLELFAGLVADFEHRPGGHTEAWAAAAALTDTDPSA